MFHNIIEDVECVFDKSRSHVDFDAVATVADGDATALVFEQSELRASRCRSTRSTVSDTGHKALLLGALMPGFRHCELLTPVEKTHFTLQHLH